ncbi:MAG: hypothetical protein KUG65_08575 [Sphingomonadaceae bacterium]|nr:hypothetical protein [Sphingomonadaceae bacterium]
MLLPALLAIGLPGCSEEQGETVAPTAPKGNTFFAISGDINASVDEATATMFKIGGKYPAIAIASSPASIKRHGTSYQANLFFSNDFTPKPGVYPVQFSYRMHPNTLGGSIMQSGTIFSHDTVGTAEFTEVGEQLKLRFEFQTFSESEGKEGRQSATVKGEAVAQFVDIF